VGESLVEFVRADRQRSAYILLVIAALLLAVCGWAAWTASRTPPAEKKPESPLQIEEPEEKVRNPNRNEYIVGSLLAGLGALAAVGVGGWLLVSLPPPPSEPARQKTEARVAILAAGGLLGAILLLACAAYFYLWSSSLSDWLDKGQTKQAKYVVGPLLAVAVGGLLMFLAIQPARAEERDNRTLRRLVYWTNLGLSVLLLFVVLVVLNVVVGLRLPNKLDVTASNFYSLSQGSKDLLHRLPEHVTAYAILPSGREYDDIRRLLQNCQDESGGKFTAKFISSTSDQAEYRALADRFPKLKAHEVEGATTGVLLTVGGDEKRNEFIRDDEFFRREPAARPGDQAGLMFVGESRLMRELLFLSESPEKTVVYFTQSAGELDISPAAREETRETASAVRLKEYLGKNNLEVKPLKFDLKEPKVPDDAVVLIVAEPERPLEEAHVAAIRKYMTEPRPGNKKGKLVVLAGASFGPPPKNEVLKTGLEGLLLEFQVRLDPRVLVGLPTRGLEPYDATAGFSVASMRARNPVAMALGEKSLFRSALWRQVAPAPGGQAYRAVPLLLTADRDRYTWLEDHAYGRGEFDQVVKQLGNNPAVQAAKQITDEPRPLAVAVSEGDAGRVVVVGNGLFVSDQYAMRSRGEPPGFDLVSGSVDWLRERPQLGITVENKKYVEFKFPATTDQTRGLLLPLLLSVTLVGGLGISVWMIRRRGA
jgi:hypothetical protein